MVDVSTWSETPGNNTSVDTVNIAEGWSPANANNSDRAIMAGVRTFHVAYTATVASLANYMPKAAGTFTGTQPIYTGEGAVLHNASASNLSGKVNVLPAGSADPSGAAGDILMLYTP